MTGIGVGAANKILDDLTKYLTPRLTPAPRPACTRRS